MVKFTDTTYKATPATTDKIPLDDWGAKNTDVAWIRWINDTTPSADTTYSSNKINTELATKSNTWHTHDDRYYTESETYTQSQVDTAITDAVDPKANNYNVVNKSANYTFLWTETNQTWYFVNTSSWNITFTIDPGVFDLTNWMYEFTICKSTSDANTLTIDAWSWNTIDTAQTYVLTGHFETVTIKVVNSTFIKTTATSNKIEPRWVYTSSSNTVYSDETEETHQWAVWTKKKWVIVQYWGTYNVVYDMKWNGTGSLDYLSNIYVNWVAVWTQRDNNTASYITYSENITVSTWDHIDIYLYEDWWISWTTYIRNFYLKWDKTSFSWFLQNG